MKLSQKRRSVGTLHGMGRRHSVKTIRRKIVTLVKKAKRMMKAKRMLSGLRRGMGRGY